MTKLRLAPDLALPLEAITETIAVLGIRGSGKTNTAAVYAEELLGAGQQVVILDPTDAWWGLKSSADGQKAGYPVVVLGGKHQDLPLASTDGKLVADFVVEQGASVVCSLRGFESKGQELAFTTAFLRRLYHLKGQQDAPAPLALMIDEASRLVPQRVMGEEAACVGAVQQIVRQGRSSGFGVVLIDQRAATVNKDVLTQMEMMIVHRTTSPQDRKALKEWVEQHDAEGHGEEFLSSLASLKIGEAWVWSPGWLDLFKRVQMRPRRTFDSSRTPRAGEVIVAPKQIAEVDLEALRAKLAATVEKAKQDDPRELRKEIAALRKELTAKPAPVVDERALARAREEGAREAERRADRLWNAYTRLRNALQNVVRVMEGIDVAMPVDADPLQRIRHTESAPPRAAVKPRAPVARTATASDATLGKGERIVLTAIAQYPDGTDREQLTVLTGYKRSSRDTYIQRLQAGGLIEVGAMIRATEAGLDALGPDFEPLPTGEALQAYWLDRLSGGERTILAALIEAYPDVLSRDALSERTEYKRSSRDTYLQRLAARKLIETIGRGEVRASETLFDEGR